MGTVSKIQHWKQIKLKDLVERHGEAIDNLPTDVLLKAIYNDGLDDDPYGETSPENILEVL